jgi:hypothetical protein
MFGQTLGHTMDLLQFKARVQWQGETLMMQRLGYGQGSLRLKMSTQVSGHRARAGFNALLSEVFYDGLAVDRLGEYHH